MKSKKRNIYIRREAQTHREEEEEKQQQQKQKPLHSVRYFS